MAEVVKSVEQLLDPNILVENVWLFSVLSVFLAMYGPRLHMKLPGSIRNLFDNAVFRGAVLFLVAYMANRDFAGALTITVIFVVTLNILHTTKVLENAAEMVSSENFQVNGSPVANCDSYKHSDANKIGMKFYPLHDNQNVQKLREVNHTKSELLADVRLDH